MEGGAGVSLFNSGVQVSHMENILTQYEPLLPSVMRSRSPLRTSVRFPMATLSCIALRWWSLLSMGSLCLDSKQTNKSAPITSLHIFSSNSCCQLLIGSTLLTDPPVIHTAGWTPWSWVWVCPSGTLEWQMVAVKRAIIHPVKKKKNPHKQSTRMLTHSVTVFKLRFHLFGSWTLTLTASMTMGMSLALDFSITS